MLNMQPSYNADKHNTDIYLTEMNKYTCLKTWAECSELLSCNHLHKTSSENNSTVNKETII